MQTITINKPDDWHVHVRDGELLRRVVPDTARRFSRAIIMPNLNPASNHDRTGGSIATAFWLPYRRELTSNLDDIVSHGRNDAG